MSSPTLTPPYVFVDPEGISVECFPVSLDTSVLEGLLSDMFRTYWDRIHFGTLVQGAVYEFAADAPPRRISMLDGYLTVDFGRCHFHLCIGPNRGTKARPTDSELARLRRTSRAEFFRRLKRDGTPNSWGFQMFNGGGEQQLTVFLPNPYLDRDQKIRRNADWSALEMWDDLRARYAHLDPDPRDRESTGFVHG